MSSQGSDWPGQIRKEEKEGDRPPGSVPQPGLQDCVLPVARAGEDILILLILHFWHRVALCTTMAAPLGRVYWKENFWKRILKVSVPHCLAAHDCLFHGPSKAQSDSPRFADLGF